MNAQGRLSRCGGGVRKIHLIVTMYKLNKNKLLYKNDPTYNAQYLYLKSFPQHMVNSSHFNNSTLTLLLIVTWLQFETIGIQYITLNALSNNCSLCILPELFFEPFITSSHEMGVVTVLPNLKYGPGSRTFELNEHHCRQFLWILLYSY